MQVWLINQIFSFNDEVEKKFTALVSQEDYNETSAIFVFCNQNKFGLKCINYSENSTIESFEISSGNKFEIKLTPVITNKHGLIR